MFDIDTFTMLASIAFCRGSSYKMSTGTVTDLTTTDTYLPVDADCVEGLKRRQL
jgi:hypothetical protein